MKQLVILSGKGGTGKTSVTAAFAHLACSGPAPIQAVLVDADVDAANLGLVLQPEKVEAHPFMGGAVAVIDNSLCLGCGNCMQACRFDAISPPASRSKANYRVGPIACDGCAACVYQCPGEAIRMQEQLAGHWYRSESRYAPLLHAELLPAQENSGKLVTLVKQQARLLGLDSGAQVVIIDGPPGIGCPVISAASGADMAMIVAEPTAAGIHDLERVVHLAQHFHLKIMVCINKADLYPAGANQIETFCAQNEAEIVGQIPFDKTVTQAMVQGLPVTDFAPSALASLAILAIWQHVVKVLLGFPPEHDLPQLG